METVTEIRRQNLNFLIEQYQTIANLNLALGRPRHDSTLSQIRNQVKINKRKGLRSMGIAMARSIEEKLHLPVGLELLTKFTLTVIRNSTILE